MELELLADAESSVPVTLTLWPTCAEILLSSTSSRYVLAEELLGVGVPAVPVVPYAPVPDVELLARVALVRMYLALESGVVPVVPVVPVVA